MRREKGSRMAHVFTAAAGILVFLALPTSAWAEEQTSAETASAVSAPAPITLTGELGGGQSRPSPSSSTSSFFYQRAAGRWSPTRTLDLAATVRATEDLSRSPSGGSAYGTSGDHVFYGGLDGAYDLSEHFTLSLGVNGSPVSQRDIGTSIVAPRRNAGSSTVDAVVRSRTSTVGGLFEVGYDSADDDKLHAVDVAITGGAALTRFGTEQSVLAPVVTPSVAPKSAALVQGRLGTTASLTILENTDLSLDFGYFVYDHKNPGDVGLFSDSTASGVTTSFGAGLPMLPARFTLRPEIGERFGRVTLSTYYQYASLAVDQATGHTVGGRAQIALGNVKLFVVGSYRADVFSDATAATWTAGTGISLRL